MKQFAYLIFVFVTCLAYRAAEASDSTLPSRQEPRFEQASSSDDFSASVGINVHINYFDRLYNNFDLVKSKLLKLSIQHVRDGAQHIGDDYDHLMYGRWMELQRLGIKFNAALDPRGSIKTLTPSAISIILDRAGEAVESFEGPNEMDISSLSDWQSEVISYQSSLMTSVRNESAENRRPVVAPSFAFVSNGLKVSGLATKADFANLHSYPAGEMPSHIFPEQMDLATKVFGNLPVMMTETGYHNALNDKHDQPAVPEIVAAKYIPRLFLENYLQGIRRTYLYELFDEAPNPSLTDNQLHWGLIRSDGTEKPAFQALASLMSSMRSRATKFPANQTVVSVSLDGQTDHVHHLFLRKTDGSYCLFLWQERSVYDTAKAREVSNLNQSVTVTFSSACTGGVRDTLHSETPSIVFTEKQQISISVPDYVLALTFQPAH